MPENSFTEIKKAVDISTRVGSNFVKYHLRNISKLEKRVAMIGDLIDFAKVHIKTHNYKDLLKSILGNFFDKHTYTEKQFLGAGNDSVLKQFREYSPDVIIISSYRYGAVEEKIKQILPEKEYSLRRQYWFPVVFLYEKSVVKTDNIFDAPILGAKDLSPKK